MSQRKGGHIQFTVGGVLHDAKGNFTYGLGTPLRESIIGADGVHGFIERHQAAFIEGEITDRSTLDLAALAGEEDVDVMLELANGKVVSLAGAWFVSEAVGNTEEGNISVRFEAKSGQEIT